MDILPARAAALEISLVALPCTVAGDAMTDPLESPKLLDVDMDQFARMFALVATNWLGRFEIAQSTDAQTLEHAADGRRRYPGLLGDLLAGEALAPEKFICLVTMMGVGRRNRRGREGRSSKPVAPSSRKRPTHLPTARTETPIALATASAR